MDNPLHLPTHLSPELGQAAFQVGYMVWPAWDISCGLLAVEEMRLSSVAVLGGNLVLKTHDGDTQTHYTTEKGMYVSTFDVEREPNESWQAFVKRSCDEASEVLGEFTPAYPIVDQKPYVPGFMLLWDTELSGLPG